MSSTVGFTSALPIRGDLGITVRSAKTREVIRRLTIKNTITHDALRALVKLISQETSVTPGDHAISSLRVGTGTTAPVRGDTGLEAAVETLTLNDDNKVPSLNNPFELKIVVTLEADKANAVTLTEAGLFTADGALFARQIHPGIPKTSALVVDYEWRISFTA